MIAPARILDLALALAIGLSVLTGPAPAAATQTASPVRLSLASIGPVPPVATASARPRPRASTADAPDRRCTDDLTHCIALASYIPDVCRTIETAARRHALDPNFFARLLWKESLFDAAAISPAGAQGIAQFMPGTAKLRGLADPFNPAKAMEASAEYLAELRRDYGNVGLAAVAYNGGEARVAKFIAGTGGLPAETRDYVQAITGHSAEAWRDAPPATLDLALAAQGGFQAACVAHAASRSLRKFRTAPPVLPWGVIVASHADRDGAARQVARLQNRHGAVLAREPVVYTRARLGGMRRSLYNAQIGRGSRAEADTLCSRLRATGGDCMVLRN